MADKLLFELVSPERLLISREVGMVVVPGAEGDFGVLPDHAPLISTVRPGVIDVYDDGSSITERIFVAGGFAEVTGERCTVLAEVAAGVKELDRVAIEKEMADLRTRQAGATEDGLRAEIAEALEIAEAKILALG